MIERSYAECTPLFQLIKLINAMRRDPTDTILEIIAQNNQSYCQFSYNIKKIYLDTYCIVLYCIMRPYTDGPIGPLSYRHSSGVVRNPHSTLAE